jgi:hypothetical protein
MTHGPDQATLERWRRKGFDLRYGPRWYLHRDGRPPEEDDRAYVWRDGCWVPVDEDDND